MKKCYLIILLICLSVGFSCWEYDKLKEDMIREQTDRIQEVDSVQRWKWEGDRDKETGEKIYTYYWDEVGDIEEETEVPGSTYTNIEEDIKSLGFWLVYFTDGTQSWVYREGNRIMSGEQKEPTSYGPFTGGHEVIRSKSVNGTKTKE